MDWDAIGKEALDDLRTLIRFETVNPPGNEGPAAAFVVERLREVGLEPEVLECEGRPNVVVRLAGDGSKGGGALLLTGHLDVVPAEEEHWSHPPFAAEIHDDYLYGRGAVDMKQMVAMCITVVRQLVREKTPLGRDIVLAVVADEETGGRCGSRFLVEEHPEKVRAECMIGEFGAVSHDVGSTRYYFVQVAEKGRCPLRLTARGRPGHGSVPHQENAIARLAEAIERLASTRLPQHRVRTVERWVRDLAAAQGFPASFVLPRVLSPRLRNIILDKLLEPTVAEPLAANLANTVCPTILEAGKRVNVIPSTATVELDGRLLPGQTGQDLVRELRQVIGDGIDIEILDEHRGRENQGDHPLLEILMSTLAEHDPEGIPIPYMLPGFTDAAFFGRLVPHCFGFCPSRFPKEDQIKVASLAHAHDERLYIPGFEWGIEVLWDAVTRFCAREG